MDLFDLAPGQEEGKPTLERISCPVLVIGVLSDVLFPAWQQRELVDELKKGGCPVAYVELDAQYGHDSFLIERERVGEPVKNHLEA